MEKLEGIIHSVPKIENDNINNFDGYLVVNGFAPIKILAKISRNATSYQVNKDGKDRTQDLLQYLLRNDSYFPEVILAGKVTDLNGLMSKIFHGIGSNKNIDNEAVKISIENFTKQSGSILHYAHLEVNNRALIRIDGNRRLALFDDTNNNDIENKEDVGNKEVPFTVILSKAPEDGRISIFEIKLFHDINFRAFWKEEVYLEKFSEEEDDKFSEFFDINKDYQLAKKLIKRVKDGIFNDYIPWLKVEKNINESYFRTACLRIAQLLLERKKFHLKESEELGKKQKKLKLKENNESEQLKHVLENTERNLSSKFETLKKEFEEFWKQKQKLNEEWNKLEKLKQDKLKNNLYSDEFKKLEEQQNELEKQKNNLEVTENELFEEFWKQKQKLNEEWNKLEKLKQDKLKNNLYSDEFKKLEEQQNELEKQKNNLEVTENELKELSQLKKQQYYIDDFIKKCEDEQQILLAIGSLVETYQSFNKEEYGNIAFLCVATYYSLLDKNLLNSFIVWAVQNGINKIPTRDDLSKEASLNLITMFNQIYKAKKNDIFISMQFGDSQSELIYEKVCRSIDKFNEKHKNTYLRLRPIRIDRTTECSSSIPDDIKKAIQSSGLIIADLSSANINVYHEIGYAMGLAESHNMAPNIILLYKENTEHNKNNKDVDKFVGFNLRNLSQLRFSSYDILVDGLCERLEKHYEV